MKSSSTRSATPAVAALVAEGVWHRTYEYDHEQNATSFGDEAVRKLGVDPRRLFKTLVVETATGQLANAVVAVAHRLDFKRIATALGTKSVELANPTAAQRKTGYVLGGISPLGQKSSLPTVLDTAVQDHETVWVSGGRRGLSLELRVADLIELSQGIVAPIHREQLATHPGGLSPSCG